MEIAVIGGGASGFFFAINAARLHPHARITIYEQSDKVLQKVRISGGGRCNVTHHCFEPAELVKRYPRGAKALRSLFHRFQPQDTIDWFAERGVTLVTEADGRMFPKTNRSSTIIDCFMRESQKYGVEIAYKMGLAKIEPTAPFQLHFKNGEVRQADKVVIACGGFSDLKKYDFLKAIGHEIVPPVPSLFTFQIADKALCALAGIAFEGAIKVDKQRFEGAMLITHWGLSGPAVLRASAVAARNLHACHYRFPIQVSWTNQSLNNITEALEKLARQSPNKQVGNAPILAIPNRLWIYLCQISNIDIYRLNQNIRKKEWQCLANHLHQTPFQVTGKATFKEEFVTAGGVDIKEIDFRTMESKILPNLYVLGEALDVDGITGGFNFQHAWSGAFVAAQHVGI